MCIETYIFYGSLASGFTYMLIRAFKKNPITLEMQNCDLFTKKTDSLAANQINVELYESYFSPIVASLLLVNNEKYTHNSEFAYCFWFFFGT